MRIKTLDILSIKCIIHYLWNFWWDRRTKERLLHKSFNIEVMELIWLLWGESRIKIIYKVRGNKTSYFFYFYHILNHFSIFFYVFAILVQKPYYFGNKCPNFIPKFTTYFNHRLIDRKDFCIFKESLSSPFRYRDWIGSGN